MSNDSPVSHSVARSSGVILKDLDDVFLASSPSGTRIFVLNRTAGLVLGALDSAHTVDEIATIIATEYDMLPTEIVKDITAIVTEFLEHGLLEALP